MSRTFLRYPQMNVKQEAAIGVIGGSGLYDMDGLKDVEYREMETPFGVPSDRIVCGRIHGKRVCFLPRHGANHHLLPHEINHRANLWALRSLDVRFLFCVTAVGSLRKEMAPRHLVIPGQLIDRTGIAAKHTFFGNGIAAHVSFADPYSAMLRKLLIDSTAAHSADFHGQATYVCMNGPAFSTRAEANFHRMMGGDIIGMTNAPETRLARETEMACAVLAMVTDYDCWIESEKPVEVDDVVANLTATSKLAKTIIAEAISHCPSQLDDPAHTALDSAIFTPFSAWPEDTVVKLLPILNRLR